MVIAWLSLRVERTGPHRDAGAARTGVARAGLDQGDEARNSETATSLATKAFLLPWWRTQP
jgi:hypothetical protein